jgi:hypothetical protein
LQCVNADDKGFRALSLKFCRLKSEARTNFISIATQLDIITQTHIYSI